MALGIRVIPDDSVIKHIPITETGAQRAEVIPGPLADMVRRLAYMRHKNEQSRAYFESDASTVNLGIAVNRNFQNVPNYLGLARTGVESLAEKVTLAAVDITPKTTIDGNEDEARKEEAIRASKILREALDESDARSVFTAAVTDSLVYGVGFIAVSPGDEDEGEPPLVLTAESPSRVTHTYSTRKSRVTDFIRLLNVVTQNGNVTRLDFVYVNDTYEMEFSTNGWCDDEKNTVTSFREPVEHGLDVCPLIALVNRADTEKAGHGRSEITPSVRSNIQKSMRTHLAMEIAREYYSAPFRYFLNLPKNVGSMAQGDYYNDVPVVTEFDDAPAEGGNAVPSRIDPKTYGANKMHSPVSADMSSVFYSESEVGVETGNDVKVGQLTGASPAALISQIKEYTMSIAAEMALPADFVGIETSNPSSAEAMKTATKRLVDRAKARADSHKPAFSQFGMMCLAITSGRDYKELRKTFRALPRFVDPNPIADSAAADGVSKLVAQGIFQPDSVIVAEKLNLTPEQTAIWLEEQRMAKTMKLAETLAAARVAVASPIESNVAEVAAAQTLTVFEG